MKRAITNLQALIHDRLINQAKVQSRSYNELFQYYLIERFLYRLSISHYADTFILKGAMAIIILDADFPRATRDIDFLKISDNSFDFIENAVKEICAVTVNDDGLFFEPESILSNPIKINDKNPGVRLTFKVYFGKASYSMQIDVGVSDKVFPAARREKYPTLIGHKEFKIKTYAPEQMIAEKVQTLVQKGQINIRLKDVFDIWWIASNISINGLILAKSIKLVFDNRQTPIPEELSFCQLDYYSQRQKIAWQSIINKIQIDESIPDLMTVLGHLKPFLIPLVESINRGVEFNFLWDPEKEWAWR